MQLIWYKYNPRNACENYKPQTTIAHQPAQAICHHLTEEQTRRRIVILRPLKKYKNNVCK